jgi:hypothetical protein
LGSGLLVGFGLQFFFEIDDFQARAHPAQGATQCPGGGGGSHPAKSFNFFLKLTIFLACAGTPPSPLGARGGAQARENVNLKKKLKGKTSQETTAQEELEST